MGDGRLWQQVFSKNHDIVSRRIAGETILVPVRGKLADLQQIFALDPVADYIWQELDGTKNLAEICNGVLANFEVDQAQARADIEEFITELLNAGLVTGEV